MYRPTTYSRLTAYTQHAPPMLLPSRGLTKAVAHRVGISLGPRSKEYPGWREVRLPAGWSVSTEHDGIPRVIVDKYHRVRLRTSWSGDPASPDADPRTYIRDIANYVHGIVYKGEIVALDVHWSTRGAMAADVARRLAGEIDYAATYRQYQRGCDNSTQAGRDTIASYAAVEEKHTATAGVLTDLLEAILIAPECGAVEWSRPRGFVHALKHEAEEQARLTAAGKPLSPHPPLVTTAA